jgi:hypothetical protein
VTDVRRLWRPVKHIDVDWDGLEGKEMENEKIDAIAVDGMPGAVAIAPDVREVYTEYAAFNDAEVWEPLFTSGALDASQRFQLDEPLFASASLWSAYRFARLHNEERAEHDKVGTYGMLVLRKRTVTRTAWTEVTYDEVDEVRR